MCSFRNVECEICMLTSYLGHSNNVYLIGEAIPESRNLARPFYGRIGHRKKEAEKCGELHKNVLANNKPA